MIQPVAFGFNPQTAANNAFQRNVSDGQVQQKAIAEFDFFVNRLKQSGIDVTVVKDTLLPSTPDSIFPNNWISFHEDGTLVLYPMYATNRRAERKPHVIEAVERKFSVRTTIDYTSFENDQVFLEGTGSMVLDREKKIAYACLSPRTHAYLVENWCLRMNYTPITFKSVDEKGCDVYHTNVMMCVADGYAVVCLQSIPDFRERAQLIEMLTESDKKIVEITLAQMNCFAGNMLQVLNNKGEKFLVMSSQAYQSLSPSQLSILESFNSVIHADLATIETCGGGSARCMMAEVFLPLR
ncbi:MAG: citrulline utilization hydrolase CtlX [Flammeovirgaceae bacterium]